MHSDSTNSNNSTNSHDFIELLPKEIYNEEYTRRVLIACEFSGIVREAFGTLYPNFCVISCDLRDTEIEPSTENQFHYTGRVEDLVRMYAFDLMVCHPPCTHLAVSGARWFKNKEEKQKEAIEFVKFLFNLPIKYIALENPKSIISTHIRSPNQCIQPWMFGDPYIKLTCFWLKNLPRLRYRPHLKVPYKDRKAFHNMHGESSSRDKDRSRFFPSLAKCMAEDWGKCLL